MYVKRLSTCLVWYYDILVVWKWSYEDGIGRPFLHVQRWEFLPATQGIRPWCVDIQVNGASQLMVEQNQHIFELLQHITLLMAHL